jgi:hypothetical protein
MMVRILVAFKTAALLALVVGIGALTLAGCKVEMVPGQGGRIDGNTGTWCREADICTLRIETTDFLEEFIAVAEPGWKFSHWKQRAGGFCSGSEENTCTLDTTNFVAFPALLEVLNSDDRYFMEPVFEPAEPLVEQWSKVFVITTETAFCAYTGAGFPIEGRRYYSRLTKYENGLLRMESLDSGFLDIADPLSQEEYFWLSTADGNYIHRFRVEWEHGGEWRVARGEVTWQLDASATLLTTEEFSTTIHYPDLGPGGLSGFHCSFETNATGHLDQDNN